MKCTYCKKETIMKKGYEYCPSCKYNFENDDFDVVEEHEALAEKITKKFVEEYYEELGSYHREEWVGEEIGGIYCMSDMFIVYENIIDFYKYKFTYNEFVEWYDLAYEHHMDRSPEISMKAFKETHE